MALIIESTRKRKSNKSRKITKQDCNGCNDDFYNGNNPYGIKECWCFKDAKMVMKKKIGINERPPYDHIHSELYPDCYKKKGYVYWAR